LYSSNFAASVMMRSTIQVSRHSLLLWKAL
jgi:hypothetical protein